MGHCHHKGMIKPITCAVITVSDTRNKNTDKSGQAIIELLKSENHSIAIYEIIQDDYDLIQTKLHNAIHQDHIEAIIFNGGTGISQRDVTIEAVRPFLQKELPGFGEIFRYLSYKHDIGSATILSRAIAGVANNRVVFSIPGSTGAVKLAMEKLILPEIKHLVKEIHKDLPERGKDIE